LFAHRRCSPRTNAWVVRTVVAVGTVGAAHASDSIGPGNRTLLLCFVPLPLYALEGRIEVRTMKFRRTQCGLPSHGTRDRIEGGHSFMGKVGTGVGGVPHGFSRE
jgi:hypothetical protein